MSNETKTPQMTLEKAFLLGFRAALGDKPAPAGVVKQSAYGRGYAHGEGALQYARTAAKNNAAVTMNSPAYQAAQRIMEATA